MSNAVICFKERAGCPGGGKGILIGYGSSFTLATNFNGAICFCANENYNEQCKNHGTLSEGIYERSEVYEPLGSAEQTAVSD